MHPRRLFSPDRQRPRKSLSDTACPTHHAEHARLHHLAQSILAVGHRFDSLLFQIRHRPSFIEIVSAADTHFGIIFFRQTIQCFQKILRCEIVAVHKRDITPLCKRNARIPRRTDAAVLFLVITDPRILFCVCPADFTALVGASIIYKKQLPVRKRLGENWNSTSIFQNFLSTFDDTG